MQQTNGNLFTRDDTFFGVCQGLGEDLGFNPNWLRVALALGLFWNPAVVAGAYVAAGVVVAFSRLIAPDPRPVATPETSEEMQTPDQDHETASHELPLAA